MILDWCVEKDIVAAAAAGEVFEFKAWFSKLLIAGWVSLLKFADRFVPSSVVQSNRKMMLGSFGRLVFYTFL